MPLMTVVAGPVAGSVDLSDDTNDQTYNQAEDNGKRLSERVEEKPAQCKRTQNDDNGGRVTSGLEGLVGIGVLISLYKEASQNGGDDACRSDDKRENSSAHLMIYDTQRQGRDK